jgi:hypothetical protein
MNRLKEIAADRDREILSRQGSEQPPTQIEAAPEAKTA